MRTRRGARALPLLAIAQLISPSLVVGQGVPRFEIATSPIQLEGPARPGTTRYVASTCATRSRVTRSS